MLYLDYQTRVLYCSPETTRPKCSNKTVTSRSRQRQDRHMTSPIHVYLKLPHLRDMCKAQLTIQLHSNFLYILWLHLTSLLDCIRTLNRDQAICSSSFTTLEQPSQISLCLNIIPHNRHATSRGTFDEAQHKSLAILVNESSHNDNNHSQHHSIITSINNTYHIPK